MTEKFKSSNNIVYSCKYHVIFCPKYRRKVLVNAVASRLKELLAQIVIDIKVEILEMEIMPDHVHLLIDVDPQFGVHRVVKRFKGATSRYLRLEFPELKSRLPSLWTNSYFVSTVGGATLDSIKMYIQNQKET
ncbi:IS200/IS605 family transposase [Tolypothrix campylonemoides VB511288_2]|uniref:IS200/IS605 family transposase n=2 Tax=Nostocales TaxID=1161 RepID=A0ABW8WVJ6_9CYAN